MDPWAEQHQCHHAGHDVTAVEPIPVEHRKSRGRSRERRRKADAAGTPRDQMTSIPRPTSHSPGRGRTPSPKRTPAPAPPNPLRCPSPAPKAVSTGDVLPSDQQGWLIDQLRGRKVWCAVADMLFCVFEKPDSKVSKQVLLLPGCRVRQVEFKTASRDNRLVNGLSRKLRSKTISGVDKFQFWIENGTNHQRFMFGVDSKEQLEQWMDVLTRVANVDADSHSPDGAEMVNGDGEKGRENDTRLSEDLERSDSEGGGDTTTPRSSTSSLSSPRYRSRAGSAGSRGDGKDGGGGGGCAYTPSQTVPRRIDFLSLSIGNAGDVRKDSVDDIRKRLRREHENTAEAKATPLKATHEETEPATTSSKTTTTTKAAEASSSRRRSFFRVGGFESLFSRSKKRSASADDAERRKALKTPASEIPRPKRGSNTSTPEETRKAPAFRKLSRAGSEELTAGVAAEKKPEKRAFLSRSWDGEKNADGLGASIRRSASDLKSRLFSTSGKSRGPGLKLADLTDCRRQGFLLYKGTVRWIKVWAVLCRGCFYGFRSDKDHESPLLVFLLPHSTVSYVTEPDNRKSRKQFSFKLSQPHCRSLHLSADNHQDLIQWLQALQQEACKVVADDDASSVETDNSSNASVDVVTSAVAKTSSGIPTLSRSWNSLTGNGSECAARTDDGPRGRAGSEVSTCSLGSVDIKSVPGPSAMASSGELTLDMTSEQLERKNSGSRIPRARSMSSFSPRSPWGVRDRNRPQREPSVDSSQSDYNALYAYETESGSSTSQPNTPRHDDALTQVWSKDKGYLLQLIRTKLLRRKKKGDGAGEGGGIYNKELSRTHEGGLLIHHGDEDGGGEEVGMSSAATSSAETLLSEVRQRSKSFTEEKTASPEQETSPPAVPPLPSLDPEWSSSPGTPRDLHHDSPAGVTSPRRQLARQRDVDDSGDVASPRGDSHGVSSVVGHLRQRVVDIDDSERDVTSFSDRDVTGDVNVNRLSVYSSEHTVRDSVRDVDTAPSSRVDERRVLVNVEHHSRTYSDAWDEYDSGEESSKAENPQNNLSTRETTKCSERSRQGDDDRTWVSSHSKTDEAVSARRSTLPRHRPAPLYSSQSQTNVFISRDNADSVVADPQDKQLARFSSSETLGRQPRGPILRYLQRTRGADHSPSTSPRAFSLDSPRERTFVFPEEFSGTSSTDTDQTLTARSSQPVQSSSSSADVVQTSSHVSQSGVATKPKHHASASSQKSSTGIPQPSRKSSSIPQRSRSASQGPPQGPRKLPSALPVSSAGSSSSTLTASVQNSRTVSSGIPIRPRSSSTGPAYSVRKPLPKRVDGSGIPGAGGRWKEEKGGRAVPPVAVRELAARDLSSPAMHGFLCRKTSSDDWVRYWYVLQEDSLYCYLTPDDHVTVDVTDLDGYSVASLEDKFPGQRFVLYLEHEDYIPVYLSASTREEMEEWYAALTSAIKIIPRINGLHLSQQHEEGESASAGPGGEERVLGIKQKLLAEVLRQTQELEKKQAARLAHKHKQSSQEDCDMHSPPSTPPPPSSHTRTGEQICTLTRLRQRRMSTQIKMDTIQRQMQSSSQQSKKSRFTFSKKKSVEEAQTPQNPDLVRQLKTLSDHLSEIDRDLMQNGGVMAIERKSASLTRGQKVNSRLSQEMESSVVEGGGGGRKSGGGGGGGGGGVEALVNEDNAIGRSNSLKSSVQKLAHRTFAKAGWHRGKKTYSLDRDDSDEKADDLYHHNNNNDSPDVIDLSRRLMRTWPARDTSQESEEGGELFLPPPSSFDSGGGTDTPSPVSSPRSPRSAGSVSSERAGSRSSSARRSEMMSRIPRRRVDPDAMANIEAFEEMSREILGEPT